MREFCFIIQRMFRKKWLLIIALLMTAVQCMLELRLPMLMADVVNTGIFGGDTQMINSIGWRMVLVCVVMGALGYAASLICAFVGQGLALDLRCELYKKIQQLSVQQAANFGTGSLITRLTTDIDTCSGLVFALIMLVAEPLLLMAGGILLMWRIDSVLGLVFVVFVVLQLLTMTIFIHKTAPGFMVMRRMLDRINTHLQNAFLNFRLIKAYGTRNDETARFYETNRTVFEKAWSVHMKLAVFNPLIMMIMDLAVASVLYISGRQVSAGTVSVGVVLSAITYAEQVLMAITAGGNMFRVIAETKPSAARILSVLEAEPDMKDGDQLPELPFKELCMEDVHFAYPDGTQVFDSLNFKISAGEMIAIVGPIGCGKTTLAGLCARLFDPTAGSVSMNGTDLRSLQLEVVRGTAVLVEKQTAVLEGSIRDNIVFGRENIGSDAVQKAVSAAQLDKYIEQSPEGLNTYLLSMGKSLSGGERQRLTIARALAGAPGLLVLDDSTSSMDYETEKNLFSALRSQYPGMAVLLTTNRLPSALRADRIIVLDDGRIIGEGTDAELRKSCDLYVRMCAAQDMGKR